MKKSVIYAIIASLTMLIIFMVFIMIVNLSVRLDALDELTIISPDISDVDDGTYIGKYELFPLSVEVEVTIVNHAYTEIIIVNQSLFFDQEASLIITMIIEGQDLAVDISENHAYSEKILLLAIVDAMTQQTLVNSD